MKKFMKNALRRVFIFAGILVPAPRIHPPKHPYATVFILDKDRRLTLLKF